MKYKLVNNVITQDYAKELLAERGVKDYDSFVNPTIECLSNPRNLNFIDDGVELIKCSVLDYPEKEIAIIVDCDVDGFTSATIMWKYLKELYPNIKLKYYIHSGKQHGLEDMIDKLEVSDNVSLVILPDAGSNDYEAHMRLYKAGIKTLVLDHHETDSISGYATIVNNQVSEFYENKDLTGAGVVWQFCRYLDEINNVNYADKYIDLAALGIISDMANVLSLENRYIIDRGLASIENFFFNSLIQKQSFSLKGKVNAMGVSWYIAPLINALIRVGTMDEKEKLFLAFLDGRESVPSTKRGEKGQQEILAEQVARTCVNARSRQNRIKEKAVDSLEIKIAKHDLLENKILFVNLDDDDDFPAVLNGLIAMQLAAKYKRPTIVARQNEQDYVRGSIRGLNNSELKDFKGFLNESSFFEYCEGRFGL